MFTWFKKMNLDFVLLQETHADETCERMWLNEWGGEGFFANGTDISRGVAILLKPGFRVKVTKVHRDPTGRFILLELTMQGVKLVLGNVYGPNSDEPSIFERMCTTLSVLDCDYIVLGGDFNFCMNISVDRQSVNRCPQNNRKCKDVIMKFADEHELVDIWRANYPSRKQFTFSRNSPPSKSRIDFFLCSKSLIYSKNSAQSEIVDGYLTDHSLVSLQLEISGYNRGRSYWKFNNSLLKEDAFQELIKMRIPQILVENEQPEISPGLLLDTLLTVLRGDIISYTSRRKKELVGQFDALQSDIDALSQLTSPTATQKVRLQAAQAERDEIISKCTHDNMFKARVRWRQLGERGTKYFHALKNRTKPPNTFSALSLRYSQGEDRFSDEIQDMLEEGRTYFADMYQKDALREPERESKFFEHIVKLRLEESRQCEGPLTELELHAALFSLKNGTSPGPAGYTAEFYKCFWQELKLVVVRALQEIQNTGMTRADFKNSVTILIPKRDKDPRYINNLRPISLLDVPYKIFTKAIAVRLGRVIKICIDGDQTGFIKGRYIGENIRLILDVMEHCNEHGKLGLLLACDFRKAYDTVDWEYLLSALKHFGFGPDLVKLVSSLYGYVSEDNLPRAVVQINGHLSRPYTIQKGLRQGCPLSCYLFLLCLEPLLTKIRAAEAIVGMQVGDADIKVTAYADDVTVLLDGSEASLENCVSLFEEFKSISGLQLNRQKTRPFWIGKNADTKRPICRHLELSWETTPLEVLGVKIPNDPDIDIGNLNYESKISQLKARLALWSYRYLTPYGRVHLIKTEALSQLTYLMTVLPKPSPILIKSIEKVMFNFIWGNKKDKIKRATLKSKYKNGGLQVPDIDCRADSLKMTWIKKYVDDEINSSWKSAVKPIFSLPNDMNIFECNMAPEVVCRKVKSAFWRETLLAWNRIKRPEKGKLSGKAVLSQVLYLNANINLESSGIYEWKLMERKNVVRIGNLYDIQNRSMYTARELISKYGFHPLSALALLKSIPLQWKRTLLAEKPATFRNYSVELVELGSAIYVAKWAYKKLFRTCVEPEISHSKWTRELNLPADMQWTEVYDALYKTTKDITIRWLQFRLIHRILPANKRLHIFGIVESNECHHCPVPESLLHVFWECSVVQTFWRAINRAYHITLDRVAVILNILKEGQHRMPTHSLQLLIVIVKQFVWRCRSNQIRPSIEEAAKMIFKVYRVEKYISVITGRSTDCEELWAPILRPLSQWRD